MWPRRSFLYVPGSNVRALEKSRSLEVDGLIFDLEDAVAPELKAQARAQVARALPSIGRSERLIRINGVGHPEHALDRAMAAESAAEGIVLPKCEDAVAVEVLRAAAPGKLIWAQIETPFGVLRAESIAAAADGLIMGTTDLARALEVDVDLSRSALWTSLQLTVLAARAHRRPILDGVHLELDDPAGFAAVCRQGRAFGFDGKTLIHPSTIPVAQAIFGPSESEVARAERLIAAYRAGIGVGAMRFEGTLIEALHVEQAEVLLARAAAIRARTSLAGAGSETN